MAGPRTVVLALLLNIAVPGTVHSQAEAALLDSLAATIRNQYVFADRADRVASELLALARGGRFRPDTAAAALALSVTREVRRLMDGDGHFRMIDPEAARPNRALVVGSRGNPDLVRGRAAAERRQGYFFRNVERRPGNVLLITFDQFPMPDEPARAAASAVMQLASAADAVIFDLRINPGGSEGLNQYLASHFFPADTTRVLYTRYVRDGDATRDTRVLGQLPGPRMPTTPVFVVTSDGTASAAENFAYTLQQHGRAVVVGEPSVGAANSSRIFPLPGGYAVQMPVARVIHPASGTNWDGTGVVPDHRARPFVAVDTAYALALRHLLAGTTDESQRAELQAAMARLAALALPDTAPGFAEYAGRYGDREVRLEGGRLVVQVFGPLRAGAILRMSHRAGDDFLIEDLPGTSSIPVRFRRNEAGRVIAIEVFGSRRGAWSSTPRDP